MIDNKKTIAKISDIDFQKGNGLIPAIIQDSKNKEVLMLGYMNQLSLEKTLEIGYVHFWSRTRNKLWMKGEESGNKLKVEQILVDCDADTLLVLVTLEGTNVCHTGAYTCFFKELDK